MEVSTIVVAALLLGGLGLVFGGVLAIVSKVFSVPADPVFDAVREVLPGANCGGCGLPGSRGTTGWQMTTGSRY